MSGLSGRKTIGAPEEPDADLESVHAGILKYFPEVIRDLGSNPQLLLKRFGRTLDSSNIGTRVSYRHWADLLEYASAELGCADLGLRLAARQGGPNTSSLMVAVIKNSGTLGEALAYTKKHTFAHSRAVRIHHKKNLRDQSMFVGYDILLGQLPNRRQAIEQILLSGQQAIREITGGQAHGRKVHFRHAPISTLGTYRRYFGCEVCFNQPANGVVYSKRDLLCPIVGADTKAREAATSLIDRNFIAPPFHAQVRGVIGQFLGTQYCRNEPVAAELGLHPKTLHRRLQAEGTSFQDIKDEVRRDAALFYLRDVSLDLTQIAEKLGYAEHSVFTRSCVRWFGKTPSRMR